MRVRGEKVGQPWDEHVARKDGWEIDAHASWNIAVSSSASWSKFDARARSCSPSGDSRSCSAARVTLASADTFTKMRRDSRFVVDRFVWKNSLSDFAAFLGSA